ncbi:uncharacterized protein LOC122062515 [Macadamia integrifolia]|uniref:uncharacterized protein LOC122062515 n=1 Tax=Macadamia integrifolia TaxID=60698 RepID=UPI001C4E9013|nr:uncharacterized protein LOC122062515 [Macadamia integrifolia]
MNGDNGRDVVDLEKLGESPLSEEINHIRLPENFKVPTFQLFDGTKDPYKHLQLYRSVMTIQGASEALLCKVFPASLEGPVTTWFSCLELRSVCDFKQLSRKFIDNFEGGKGHQKTSSDLMEVKQRPSETLKQFILPLDLEKLKIRDIDPIVELMALKSGVREERLRFSLSKSEPKSLAHLRENIHRYSNVEELTANQPDTNPQVDRPKSFR